MKDLSVQILTAPQGKTHLFFLGQAGFVVKSAAGELLAVDLYLSDCVERLEGHMGFKRLQPALLNPEDVCFDWVITTHPHWDHFDVDAVPGFMANRKTRLYASIECRPLSVMLRLDAQRIQYVRVGDQARCGDFDIQFVFCDHGDGAPDAFGLVITVDGKKIYMAGDTCLRLDKAAQIAELGPFDIMIAPINGAFGNLSERECAVLSAHLKPALTIPCHYGICAAHGGEPGKFMTHMAQEAPGQKYLLMANGEQLIIE